VTGPRQVSGTIVAEMWRVELHNRPFSSEMAEDAVTGIASGSRIEDRESIGRRLFVRSSVISISPVVMGGTPVFAGTRVPVENLLDYLEGGESIDDFLEGFPSVTREQVITFLHETKALVLAEVG
jgi:uncharacterized protein (DUF433 family)